MKFASRPDAGRGMVPATALEEQAYRQLRQALMEGVFAPGERLSIRRVADAMSISPMPARTALRRLAAEQALDIIASSGTAVVPRLSRKSFTELSSVRAELEPLAMRMACPHLTRSDLVKLDRVVEQHQEALKRGDPAASLAADREFLFTLFRRADAPMLLGFIESVWLRRGPIFWEARWIFMGRAESWNRHREILVALTNIDVETAAQTLRLEIESAKALLLSEFAFADDARLNHGLTSLSDRRRAAESKPP